ncbi:serine/threonine-protein kinase [Streptomyces boninensis]|uniref:serine/threonine-protein kinase n=1 Tax=Streptomyces boninensis TaxID=2039455 RepID=UPI003B21DAB2
MTDSDAFDWLGLLPYLVLLAAGVLIVLGVRNVLRGRAARLAAARRADLAATYSPDTVAAKDTVAAPAPVPAPATAPATVRDAGNGNGPLSGGRFAPLEELGRGGMGVVWRAQDRVLGREVAIKQLLPPAGFAAEARDSMRARLLREARAAARLDHKGAVTVHDVLLDQESVIIVMELVKSAATLHATVADAGPLPPGRVAALGVELLDVLTEAHGLGIIHRDVKPANVLVRQDGSVKLADFGIARLEGDPTLTEAGAVMGTPAYMAPEQIRGHEPGPATDLWGLGVTLFYAVEGQPPFRGPSPTAAMAAVLTDPPAVPERAGPVLGRLLAGLLAKDPVGRPGAEELRAGLRSAFSTTGE